MIWASHNIMIYRNPESMFVLEVPNGVNLIPDTGEIGECETNHVGVVSDKEESRVSCSSFCRVPHCLVVFCCK